MTDLFEPLPKKTYKIIYLDPPWQYRDKQKNYPGIQYPTMKTEDIAKLPVSQIVDKDSFICMWVTFPQLPEAFKLFDAWGFKYKTKLFTWIKTYPSSGKKFLGMGHYTRSNDEIVLLGKKGKGIPVKNHNIHSVQEHPILKHSEKPDMFRKLIVDLFDAENISKIELFSRHSNLPGWDVWGNQVGLLDNV